MKLRTRPSSAAAAVVLSVVASCGGGGGGGGAAGGSKPTVPSGAIAPPVPGLVSLVAGDGVVRASFVRPAGSAQFALFAGTSGAGLFAGAPLVVDPPGEAFEVSGLANGQRLHVGVATRASASDPWTPTGPALTARPNPPIYVDPDASAAGADGLTPATAFPDPATAFVVAAGAGGNVWLREGDYGPTSLVVFDGLEVHGGFAAGFDLATRDPESRPTVLRGQAGSRILAVAGGGVGVVVDGLRLEGDGVATLGFDALDTPIELRSITITDCADRGMRVRGPLDGDSMEVVVANVTSNSNGADGFSAAGALELSVFASRFQGNVQEGIEIDDLLVDSGRLASLRVEGCSFAGNGAEGLDVDLAVPLTAVPPGGSFRVSFRDSVFERNALAGLLVDIDYETTPQWSAEIEVAGCVARANGGAGVALDLDSTQTSFVHRCVLAANGQAGLLVTSESAPGVTVVSASTLVGNRGGGVRAALGNVPVLVSHCVFEGNVGTGAASETVASTSASSLFWLQPGANLGLTSVGDGVAAPGDLAQVPIAFVTATGTAAGDFDVDTPGALAVGDLVDLGLDGVGRGVLSVVGSTVDVDPDPEPFPAPLTLAVFGRAPDVTFDHTLLPGASALGVGMTSTGGPFVDPGPLGSPDGAEPGPVGDVAGSWFRPGSVVPAPIAPLGASDLVRVAFDRDLAPGSATASSVRAYDGVGTPLVPAIAVVAGALELSAPVGGWPASVRIELDRGLESVGGDALAAPVVLLFE
ncbi:MAG: right-handed parallel beta-helix repeat-containing protein [Planctomycetota bacterium]